MLKFDPRETCLENPKINEYAEIFSLPSVLICVIGNEGKFLKTNPAQLHILGWDPSELIGRPVSGYVLPADREKTAAVIGKILTTGELIQDFRNRCIHKQGGYRWISWTGTAKDGLLYCVGFDITDRVRAEERDKFLNELSDTLTTSLDSQEMLRSLTELAVSHFCDFSFVDLIRPGGRSERVAAAHRDPGKRAMLFELQSRYTAQSDHPIPRTAQTGKSMLFKKPDQDLLERLRKSEGEEFHRKVLTLGYRSTIIAQLRGRERILGTLLVATSEESGRDLDEQHQRIVEDLAHRAAIAIENAMLYQDSQDAIRARDEFLSIASHELKTPLTSLILHTQTRQRNLERELPGAFARDRLQKMFDTDLRLLTRLNRLIGDMLDIARITSGKLTMQPVRADISQIAREALERLAPQFERAGCKVDFSDPGPHWVLADPHRIEQVLVNVLTNAAKYGAGQPIHVVLSGTGSTARISIQDEGRGIAPEDQKRIFGRFERAVSADEVPGLGLGLYIARQIVERHGGSIRVKSEKNQGAEFIIELPLLAP